ncbi:hypothetical protein ACHHYP_14548 [Achlya hypogyna]|uniref:Claudin-like protein n=1 Tax=Achlya hypogyna TaxID=1202772 RepID=A0A1V9YCW0_ACHHY|nr:hypothetical protein ACHHYP_14548 [Achlya hypogyna]
MYAGLVIAGLLAYAIAVTTVFYAAVAPDVAWSRVEIVVADAAAAAPSEFSIAFSPREYCISQPKGFMVCLEYGSTELPLDVDARLLDFIAASWCGCSVNRRFDFAATMQHAMCSLIMQVCQSLLMYFVAPVVLIAGAIFVGCLTYFQHEAILGKALCALTCTALVGLLVILGIWWAFDDMSFNATHDRLGNKTPPWQHGGVLWALTASVASLGYCIWLSTLLIKKQYLRYSNRQHVRTLKQNPLECPANYA